MHEKAQQLSDQALKSLIDSISAGHSETLTTYLKTMAKFHHYSYFNSMLIWLQKPTSTRVAGFRKWVQLGRHVKPEEKGIMILAPVTYKKLPGSQVESDDDDDEKTSAKYFTAVWVFDIAQTEGKELPDIGRRTGDPGVHASKLRDFATSQNIEVTEVDVLGGALGVSRGGRIDLLAGLAPAEKFGVLAHELAHEFLHHGPNRGQKTRRVRETEAEAVAFVVCEAVGVTNGSASADYIHLYQGDDKLLMESLSTIQKVSSRILKEVLV